MTVGRPQLCVGAVAVKEENLLLIKRGTEPERGSWSLPGGRVEFGESVIAAVVREFYEETGLECVCGDLLSWVERMDLEYHFVILDFSVTVLDSKEPKASGDAAEVRWVKFADLKDLKLVQGLMDFLSECGVVSEEQLFIIK